MTTTTSENKTDSKSNRPYFRLHLLNWGLLIAFIVFMTPVVYACQYLYSQGDDNTYSILPHLAWVHTHNLWNVFVAALKQVHTSYLNWQGTYTSIFLMALEPGLFAQELYHIAPMLIIIPFCLANWFLIDTILHRLLHVNRTLSNGLSILTILLLVENPRQVAEAFTWYNSAVHYTGIHTLWLFTFALLLRRIFLEPKKKINGILFTICLCILQFIVGGGNNLSVLEAVLVEAVLGLYLIAFEHKDKKKHLLRLLVPFLFLLTGALTNFLAPGNAIRMGEGGAALSVPETILYCFAAGAHYTVDWFSIPTAIYVLWALIYGYYITKELSKSDVSVPMPGLIALALFCLFSAIFAPNIYTGGADGTTLKRTQNVAYYHYVLLLMCGILYCGTWLRKKWDARNITLNTKQIKQKKILAPIYFAGILVISIIGIVRVNLGAPMHLTTSAAVHCITSGGGEAWAETIRNNLALIESSSDDEVIIVEEPLTEEEFIRTNPRENEMATWRYGLSAYYEKKSILYERELYEDE